jgi:hypothetical protein
MFMIGSIVESTSTVSDLSVQYDLRCSCCFYVVKSEFVCLQEDREADIRL